MEIMAKSHISDLTFSFRIHVSDIDLISKINSIVLESHLRRHSLSEDWCVNLLLDAVSDGRKYEICQQSDMYGFYTVLPLHLRIWFRYSHLYFLQTFGIQTYTDIVFDHYFLKKKLRFIVRWNLFGCIYFIEVDILKYTISRLNEPSKQWTILMTKWKLDNKLITFHSIYAVYVYASAICIHSFHLH